MRECLNARMLECENAGMLECENAGMLECENAGMLECENVCCCYCHIFFNIYILAGWFYRSLLGTTIKNLKPKNSPFV